MYLVLPRLLTLLVLVVALELPLPAQGIVHRRSSTTGDGVARRFLPAAPPYKTLSFLQYIDHFNYRDTRRFEQKYLLTGT